MIFNLLGKKWSVQCKNTWGKKGKVYLCVADNGVGLPEGTNYENTDSLGLQLVMALVEQVNGTIELDSEKGVKYTITFKKEQ